MSRITNPNKQLSDDRLRELKYNAYQMLSEFRRKLIVRFPFTGQIAMSLDLVPTRDNRIRTAATDGSKIFFDIAFLSSLKPDEALFVLAHEVWHVVMQHMTREAKRDHNIANIAEDVEVNEILIKEGLTCPIDACTCGTKSLPKDKSFEDYYEILIGRHNDGSQADAESQNSSNAPTGGNKDGSKADAESQNSSNAPTGGNKDGSKGGQFDKHLHKGDDIEADKGDENCVDKYGKVGTDEDYTPAVKENLAEKIRETLISAAQSIERSRGELPGHLKQIVNELMTPKIKWQETLAEFIIKSNGEGHVNWNVPNRRHAYRKLYLPSHTSEKVRIGVVVDTSGSCIQDIQKFLSEINGIVKSFGDYELHLCQCDWDVKSFDRYDNDNPLDLETQKFEMYGGGGTRLMPGLQSFEQHEVNVDAIVCFSDCECETIEENAVEVPVLWICTTNTNHKNIKCGKIIPFNDKHTNE